MHRFRTSTRRLISPTLGRLTLAFSVCVSLVQIPIPIVHHHASIESETALRTHLARSHQWDDESLDECHVHFVLPCQMGDHDERSSEGHASPHPAAVASDYNSSSGNMMLAELTTLNHLIDHPSMTAPWLLSAKNFNIDRTAGNLSPSARACVLLCVIRC